MSVRELAIQPTQRVMRYVLQYRGAFLSRRVSVGGFAERGSWLCRFVEVHACVESVPGVGGTRAR